MLQSEYSIIYAHWNPFRDSLVTVAEFPPPASLIHEIEML